MSKAMSGSTKAILVLVVVIAIVIPIALGVVLLNGPPSLPSKTTSAPSTSSSSGPGTGGTTIAMPSGVGSNQQLNFSPATTSVTAGTTITFVNQDSAVHNVDWTSVPSGSSVTQGTTSSNMHQGATYTVTLTTPGTYTYVCDFHSWMKGTITVTG